ncbi:unnamed protein product [Pylaiella littoralis]
MRWIHLPLLVLAFCPSSMPTAAAVEGTQDATITGVQTEKELLPRSAGRGSRACEQHPGVLDMRLQCVMPGENSRSVYTPIGGCRMHLTIGDGQCGYRAVGGALIKSKGYARSKTVEDLKRLTQEAAIRHIMQGATPAAAAAAAAPPPTEEFGNRLISRDQLDRARSLRLSQIRDLWGELVDEVDPSERTADWVDKTVKKRVEEDWLDVTWLGLLADNLGVNIVLWEPSGIDRLLRIYSAGGSKGLFLYDKKDRMDEEGDHWLHLLYHTDSRPFTARAEITLSQDDPVAHNHFTWIDLGSDAVTDFITAMSSRQQQQQEGGTGPLRGARKRTGTTQSRDKQKRKQPDQPPKGNGGTSKKPGLETPQPLDKPAKIEKGVKKRRARKGGDDKVVKEKDVCYDSDGNIGGGDDFESAGAFACLTINPRKLTSDIGKIPEIAYKRAFLKSSQRKALGLKVTERQDTHSPSHRCRRRIRLDAKSSSEEGGLPCGRRGRHQSSDRRYG